MSPNVSDGVNRALDRILYTSERVATISPPPEQLEKRPVQLPIIKIPSKTIKASIFRQPIVSIPPLQQLLGNPPPVGTVSQPGQPQGFTRQQPPPPSTDLGARQALESKLGMIRTQTEEGLPWWLYPESSYKKTLADIQAAREERARSGVSGFVEQKILRPLYEKAGESTHGEFLQAQVSQLAGLSLEQKPFYEMPTQEKILTVVLDIGAAIPWGSVLSGTGRQVIKQVAKDEAMSIYNTTFGRSLDAVIAKRARGFPPDQFNRFQNLVYDVVAKNKISIQESATNRMLFHRGKTPNTLQAIKLAAEDTVADIEARLIPRGTKTGAMAFGGREFKPQISPPTEVLSPEDEVLNTFGKKIASPKTTEAFATQKELWATERAVRANRFAELLQQEIGKGTGAEEAIKKATSAFQGEFPRVSTGLDLPPEFKDAAYAKIIKVIQADFTIPEATKAFEIAGTKTALDNALMGKPIPDIAGIKGGSAKARLLKVFADNPIIKEIIENPKAVQKRLLENALPPETLDATTLEYLRNLPTKPFGMARLGEVYTPSPAITVAKEAYKGQGYQELLIDLAKLPSTVTMLPEQAIKRFEQFTNLPPTQRVRILTILNKIGVNAVDALGLIKSLVFSFDVSFPFRQGALLGARNPIGWVRGWKPMFQALKSEQVTMKFNHEILTDPLRMEAINILKLDVYGVEKGLGYMARPESMASLFAEKYVPGVRPSARAAATFMNYLMTDTGKRTIKVMRKMGVSQEEYGSMGEFINWAAGRGTIPKPLQGTLGAFLNDLLASPRYVASRLELPTKLFSSSKAVRQEAASTFAAFLAMKGSIDALVVASGRAKMEIDPRSADAYKLRVGDKRIDQWVGFAQITRFLAQMATGQRKTETGEIISIPRSQVLGRFAQSKESPGIGALVTLLSGENYVGEKIDFKKLQDIGKFAKETFMPAGLQEMVDAYVQEGVGGAGVSGLGLVGVGISTYPPRELEKWKESISASLGREVTIEESANLRPDFDRMRELWLTYQDIKSSAGKDNWLEKNPTEDALFYFWGKKSTLETPEARNEFQTLLQKTGFPEEAFPIREPVESVEMKGMKKEELFDSLTNLMPKYLADYVITNKEEWQAKDIPALVKILEDIKASDQNLLDKYYLAILGTDSRFRENYRRRNPDIDATLNFWGKVSTTQSRRADTILRERASKLGMSYRVFPALE